MKLDLLSSIFLFVWLMANFENLVYLVYLWQLKEYRLDRMRAHLSTSKGRREVFNFFFILKFLTYLYLIFSGLTANQENGRLLLLSFYGIDALWSLRAFLTRRLKKPKLTPKAGLTIILALLFQALFLKFRFGAVFSFNPFLEANLLLIIGVSLGVALLSFPSRIGKEVVIIRARDRLKHHPGLKVIGITGSFGKTSTKEFLTRILEGSFRVLSTAKHENTAIGVAKQILRELTKDHQVYVVEMGAYKRGEIEAICHLVSPQIGVLTGLGTQHLSLFGSLDNLLKAKFELIKSLPRNGLAVFNGDNDLCLQLASQTTVKKTFYSTKNPRASLYAYMIKVFKRKIVFMVRKGAKTTRLEVKLLGRQNVPNLLAALAVGSHLGLGQDEMAKQASQIKSLPGTMRLISGPRGIFLVDDTYNSNPEGVLAALEYLSIFPQKKFLVLQPMIELGLETLNEHRRVLEKAVNVCELVCLTNNNFYQKVLKLFSEEDRGRVVLAKNPISLIKKLGFLLENGSVILFAGREAEKYLEVFQKGACYVAAD